MIFFLNINLEKENDMLKTNDDPLPKCIETKLMNIVYISKILPSEDGQPCYEYFEMQYDLLNSFQDKVQMHEALELSIIKQE